MLRWLHLGAIVSLLALIALNLAWEARLAPSGGRVVLILKTVPLLFPLFGILRAKRYTYQWSSMLILLYFTEGVVRAYGEQGIASRLAMAEVALTVIFYLCAIFYARLTRKA
jgi:uncharacterized membrane protein